LTPLYCISWSFNFLIISGLSLRSIIGVSLIDSQLFKNLLTSPGKNLQNTLVNCLEGLISSEPLERINSAYDSLKSNIYDYTGDLDSKTDIIVAFTIIIFILPIIALIGHLVGMILCNRKFFIGINFYGMVVMTIIFIMGSASFVL